MLLFSFNTPWKHQTISNFLNIFRGYKKRPVPWNELTHLSLLLHFIYNPFISFTASLVLMMLFLRKLKRILLCDPSKHHLKAFLSHSLASWNLKVVSCQRVIFMLWHIIVFGLGKKSPYSELFWSSIFSHFPEFGLNTDRYGVSLRIQSAYGVSLRIKSEYGKIREECGPE